MNCPRCNKSTASEIIRDVKVSLEVDKCTSCGGIWFDKGELAKIDKLVEPTLYEIRTIPNKKEQLKALYCPSCGNHPLMEKAEHSRDNKVLMDYCPQCKGIWLDKNELEAIQRENLIITIGKILSWLFGKD